MRGHMCFSLPFLTIPEVTGTVETISLDCRVTLVPIEMFQALSTSEEVDAGFTSVLPVDGHGGEAHLIPASAWSQIIPQGALSALASGLVVFTVIRGEEPELHFRRNWGEAYATAMEPTAAVATTRAPAMTRTSPRATAVPVPSMEASAMAIVMLDVVEQLRMMREELVVVRREQRALEQRLIGPRGASTAAMSSSGPPTPLAKAVGPAVGSTSVAAKASGARACELGGSPPLGGAVEADVAPASLSRERVSGRLLEELIARRGDEATQAIQLEMFRVLEDLRLNRSPTR